jgi:hypothetical protein
MSTKIREIIEQIEKIRKMVDWAELNRQADDFVRIRLELNALKNVLKEEIRSHESMIQERV